MRTATVDDHLAEAGRRIGRLQALAQAGAAGGASPRLRRHLAALREEEASVLAAARKAPDEVEEKIVRLKTRLAVAEHSAAADVSHDWATFAASVEGELRSWGTYLERLQASVASTTWTTRQQAEAVRSRGIAVYDQLAQTRGSVGADWQGPRNRVTAARNELEQKADELSATLKKRSTT